MTTAPAVPLEVHRFINNSRGLTTLSAASLDVWDRCPRRWAFERDYALRDTTPLALCYRALDAALTAPTADDPEEVAKSAALGIIARQDFSGVWGPVSATLDNYTIALHHGALAGLLARVLRSRLGGPLAHVPPQPLPFAPATQWHSALYAAPDGERHRFVLCSHADDDRLRAEAHSWATIGELVALAAPLTLHLLVIGPARDGRRVSPWTQGLLHPTASLLRFAKRRPLGGSPTYQNRNAGLGDNWRKVWREQLPEVATERWLRQMQEDGVLEPALKRRVLRYDPADARLQQAQHDVLDAMTWMQVATPDVAMRRSACDDWRGPCPFAPICYSSTKKAPADAPGLYVLR